MTCAYEGEALSLTGYISNNYVNKALRITPEMLFQFYSTEENDLAEVFATVNSIRNFYQK